MKDLMKYKEFLGSVHFNSEDEVFYGKIEEIDDLISFEGKTVPELKKSFNRAVDDYVVLCNENNKELYKSYKGSFNIRIPPELHRKAVRKSILEGLSLNQFVQKAIEKEIEQKKIIHQRKASPTADITV